MKKIFFSIFSILYILIVSATAIADGNISSSNLSEEIEVQKAIAGKWYSCGDDFRFMFLYQPVMTKSQSYQTAEGMFILFRVWISNDSGKPLAGLKNDSFKLSRENKGNSTDFSLSGGHSRITSQAWQIDLLQDAFPALSKKDTFLVFDVDGNWNDPWVLTFSPIEKGTEEKLCTIKLMLPEISRK